MPVRIIARLRPLMSCESEDDRIVSVEQPSNTGLPETSSDSDPQTQSLLRIPNPRNESELFTFSFNRVYEASSSQAEIFDQEVSPTLTSVFDGRDVTIFTHGVTGTGKTYTMRGGQADRDRGIIPRLLNAIFQRAHLIEQTSNNRTKVTVVLTYYEVLNDRVYDLFTTTGHRPTGGLPVRDCGKAGRSIVLGLSEINCTSPREFEQIYSRANQRRSTAVTKLNAQSSRSHAVLNIRVTQKTYTRFDDSSEQLSSDDASSSCLSESEQTDDYVQNICSTVSAIDLAGAEDNRRTGNGRSHARMRESASINQSLFVLAKCVEALTRGHGHVPYRESKMTRILNIGQYPSEGTRRSLIKCGAQKGNISISEGGACVVLMILTIAPVRSFWLHTLSSLNFASRAKSVDVVSNRENVSVITSALSAYRSSVNQHSHVSLALTVPGSGVHRVPFRLLRGTTHNNIAATADTTENQLNTVNHSATSGFDTTRSTLNSQTYITTGGHISLACKPVDMSNEKSGYGRLSMLIDTLDGAWNQPQLGSINPCTTPIASKRELSSGGEYAASPTSIKIATAVSMGGISPSTFKQFLRRKVEVVMSEKLAQLERLILAEDEFVTMDHGSFKSKLLRSIRNFEASPPREKFVGEMSTPEAMTEAEAMPIITQKNCVMAKGDYNDVVKNCGHMVNHAICVGSDGANPLMTESTVQNELSGVGLIEQRLLHTKPKKVKSRIRTRNTRENAQSHPQPNIHASVQTTTGYDSEMRQISTFSEEKPGGTSDGSGGDNELQDLCTRTTKRVEYPLESSPEEPVRRQSKRCAKKSEPKSAKEATVKKTVRFDLDNCVERIIIFEDESSYVESENEGARCRSTESRANGKNGGGLRISKKPQKAYKKSRVRLRGLDKLGESDSNKYENKVKDVDKLLTTAIADSHGDDNRVNVNETYHECDVGQAYQRRSQRQLQRQMRV